MVKMAIALTAYQCELWDTKKQFKRLIVCIAIEWSDLFFLDDVTVAVAMVQGYYIYNLN